MKAEVASLRDGLNRVEALLDSYGARLDHLEARVNHELAKYE